MFGVRFQGGSGVSSVAFSVSVAVPLPVPPPVSVAGLSLPSSTTSPSTASSSFSSSRPWSSLCAHGVRGVAASWAFHRNAPLSSILESATWSSAFVFTSFYISDVQFSSHGFSLGPLVAAGSVV